MKRVAIVGSGGSGKSTFARALGERAGLDVFHLDRLFWKPGWVETPRDEWRTVQHDLVARDSWIIDGNYSGTLDIRLRAADTVFFFDFARLVCLRRAVWRSVRNHGKAIQAPGCPERLDLAFYRWIWNYPKTSRPVVIESIATHARNARVCVAKTRRDAALLLET